VGEALDYAHDGLAIHRDIKPGNLILRADDRVKILDFGLARLMSHSQYKASTRVGSVAYMAPEQFEGATGLNTDLWALGVTFFQLLTNVLPFPARDEAELVHQILYEVPELSPVEGAGFDPRLVRVLRKILEKDPEKRYLRAAEFIADLKAVLRHAASLGYVEGNLEIHLRAHFPLIYLHTYEEERALAALARVRDVMAGDRPLNLLVWSETRGLRNTQGQAITRQSSRDPVAALQHVIDSQQEGIYVFLDMHRHFTPVTVRLVRDCVWTVKRQRKSLVFVSPDLRLPEELRSDTTLIFFDPPDVSELQALVDAVATEIGQSVSGELRERLARAVLGLTHREADRALRRGVLRERGLTDRCATAVLAEKEQIVRKEGILEFRRPEVSFADVGGLERLKAWFTERRQAFSPEGRRFGLRLPRGAVLAGVPGCGKSLSAKALAADWQVPLLRLDLGRVYRSLLGQSEANLRRALHTAEQVSPCVLWIDELEKAFAGLGQVHDSGVTQRLFGTFLTWMEERQSPVFVVATANDIGRLPPEFTRKGRFDEVFFVDLPGTDERRSIFSVHLLRRQRAVDEFDLNTLAQASETYSGAEIEESVISGLYRAFDAGQRDLTTEDVRQGLAETIPLARSRADDVQTMRQWAAVNARQA
jgi:ATP-dependent 26S proteasome regulatory subunit